MKMTMQIHRKVLGHKVNWTQALSNEHVHHKQGKHGSPKLS